MPEEEKEAEKEKKGLLDLRLIIVAVAIIILAAGIAYIVAKLVYNPADEPDENNETISSTIGPTYELDEFTVNLADSGGRRFIKTNMIIVISNNNLQKELDEKRPLLRDKIIMILGEKTISDIETATGKEGLKQEIISKINPLLLTGEVKEVYFDSFVFQ